MALSSNPVSDLLNSLQVQRRKAGSGVPLDPASIGNTPPPPAPPATPPAGTSINVSTTPDFKGVLTGDPAYVMARGNADASNLDASKLRQAIIQHAVMQYGGVPDFSKLTALQPGAFDAVNDIDPVTADIARENTAAGTSVLGQLQHAQHTDQSNLLASLASRGILDSGQSALEQGELGRAYAGKLDSAQQSLFDALTKAQQDYLTTKTSNTQNLDTLLGQVADRLQSSGQFDPQKFTASIDPGFTSGAGGSVYKDANGNYWTGDGSAVGKNDLKPTNNAGPLPFVHSGPAQAA